MKYNRLKTFAPFFFLIYFTGCTSIPSLQERQQTLQTIIQAKSYKSETVSTTTFNLLAIKDKHLNQCMNQPLKVYIEGDGLSWVAKHTISDDPSPIKPLGLELMSLDESPCKVYLARPCQYIHSNNCLEKYWTSHRFAPQIIRSYQEALDHLKQTYRTNSFLLIGYSGGGTVAILTAASRNDVKKIITIAGNVDTQKWIKLHNLDPLNGSLNPADYANQVENIDQIHLIGTNDTVVPKEVFFSYLNRFNDKRHVHYQFMDAAHSKNWKSNYKTFLESYR